MNGNDGVNLGQAQFHDTGQAPVDTANGLLAEGPMTVHFAKVQTQKGQRLAVTFRTPSTTFTAFFDRASGMAAGGKIVEECGQLTGLVVPQGSTFSAVKTET